MNKNYLNMISLYGISIAVLVIFAALLESAPSASAAFKRGENNDPTAGSYASSRPSAENEPLTADLTPWLLSGGAILFLAINIIYILQSKKKS